jgi:hypothetical protein
MRRWVYSLAEKHQVVWWATLQSETDATPRSFPAAATILYQKLLREAEAEKTELVLCWSECDYEDDDHEEKIEKFRVLAGSSCADYHHYGAHCELDENCTSGENGENHLTLQLVRKADQHVMAQMNVLMWTSIATLQQFNMHAQALADFSRILWSAAGRPQDEYSDAAIEFGHSPHSRQPCNELIAEACGEDFEDNLSCSTIYLDKEIYQKHPPLPEDMKTLLSKAQGFFESAYFVGHNHDLPEGLRFAELPDWQPLTRGGMWHVRMPEDFFDYKSVNSADNSSGASSSAATILPAGIGALTTPAQVATMSQDDLCAAQAAIAAELQRRALANP